MKFDSKEEKLFYYWCIKAKKMNLIDDFEYHTPECEFKLIDKKQFLIETKVRKKIKLKSKHLLRSLNYTCDFILKIKDIHKVNELNLKFSEYNETEEELFIKQDVDYFKIYIDIKGSFNKWKRNFSIIQKITFEKHNIYINEVKIPDFFKYSFCPLCNLITGKKRQILKAYKNFDLK